MGKHSDIDLELVILRYGPEVKRIAKKWYYRVNGQDNPAFELDDLIQCGYVGLCQCVGRFDPDRNVDLFIYARRRIKGEIIDYLRKSPLVRLSEKDKDMIDEWTKKKDELFQELNREPSNEEIIDALGIDVSEVPEGYASSEIFDEQRGHGQKSFKDNLIERIGIKNDYEQCRKKLSDEEKLILEFRSEDVKLRELVPAFGANVQTVSRKRKKAEDKMRACMRRKGWQLERSR